MSAPKDSLQDASSQNVSQEPQESSFLATVFAVLSAFIGIRKRRDYERDALRLKPVHVIVAGIIGAALFFFTILMLVKWLMVNR